MTLLQKIQKAIKKPKDIIHYCLGNFRYKLYYSKYKWLIQPHIIEQIDSRVDLWMDRECYNQGSCKICGCVTTALQMCNKSCDKPCYPPMMSVTRWEGFKKGGVFKDHKTNHIWLLKEDKLFLYTEENLNGYVQVN